MADFVTRILLNTNDYDKNLSKVVAKTRGAKKAQEELSGVIGEAAGRFGGFTSSLNGSIGALSKFTTPAGMAAAAALSVGAALAKCASVNEKFQVSFARLNLLSATKQLEEFKTQALELTRKDGFTMGLDNIGTAQESIIRMAQANRQSVDTKSIAAYVEQLDQYATIVGHLYDEAEQTAIEDIASISRAWDVPLERMPEITAMLINISAVSGKSAQDVANTMNLLAGDAQSVGASLSDFGAAIEQLTPKYGTTSQAGQRYIQVLKKMEASNIQEFMPSVHGASVALSNLNDYVKAGGDVNKMFGARLASTAKYVASFATDINNASQNITDNTRYTNAATDANNSLIAINSDLQNSWENLKTVLGNDLMPIWKDFLKAITKTVDGLSKVVGKVDSISSKYNRLKNAIDPKGDNTLRHWIFGDSAEQFKHKRAGHHRQQDRRTGKWYWADARGRNVEARDEIQKVTASVAPDIQTGGTPNVDPNKNTVIKKHEEIFPEGSIARLNQQMSELGKKRDKLTDVNDIAAVEEEINKVTNQIKAIKSEADLINFGKRVEKLKEISPDMRMPETVGIDATEGNKAKVKADLTPPGRWELADFSETISKAIPPVRVMTKTEKMQRDMNDMADVAYNLGDSLQQMANIADDSTFNVAATIAQAVATILQGYATASKESASMGPIGWAAFSLAGLAQVLSIISAVKSAGSFAYGGIVPGTSYSGDRLTANVNSGEMIINQHQQRNLFSMLNGNSVGAGVSGNVIFKISGDNLYGVLRNHNNKTGKL